MTKERNVWQPVIPDDPPTKEPTNPVTEQLEEAARKLDNAGWPGSAAHVRSVIAKPVEPGVIERLREVLLEIELSARGSGPMARDRDADTLRAIGLRCRQVAADLRLARSGAVGRGRQPPITTSGPTPLPIAVRINMALDSVPGTGGYGGVNALTLRQWLAGDNRAPAFRHRLAVRLLFDDLVAVSAIKAIGGDRG